MAIPEQDWKMAPEHRRLLRYRTMELEEILEPPVSRLAAAKSHLYLWVPNALLQEGLQLLEAWGFTYKCGSMRTLAPGRPQVNVLPTRKREHSRKPDEIYDVIESCSPVPISRFSRGSDEPAGISGAMKM